MEKLGVMKVVLIGLLAADVALSIKGKRILLAITSICAATLCVIIFVEGLKNGESGQMAVQYLYAIPELIIFYIFREGEKKL